MTSEPRTTRATSRRGLGWWLITAVALVAATALVWQRRPTTPDAADAASPPAAATPALAAAAAPLPTFVEHNAAEGSPAPPFHVTDVTGATVDLSALRGKAVAVYFLSTDACASCETGATNLRAALDTVGSSRAEVIAVDYDPADTRTALDGFARGVGSPPFRWVLDTDTTMAKLFQPKALSEVIVINRDGVIVKRAVADTDAATVTGWIQAAST